MLRDIETVEIAALARESADGAVRVSLRGKRRADVCRIAVQFGGGGHRLAAGCTLHVPVGDAAGMILEAARGCKSRNVVLSGGVFMNRILLDRSMELLENEGYHVYINSQVPPNDGGIALGQLWLVAKEWELCV